MLYVSYDGMLEPLGQSQVLPYLRGLAERGARIWLLSFEKPADRADRSRMAALRADLDARGIHWTAMTYHKRPSVLATAFDVAAGCLRANALVARNGITAVHARSYVPALIAWIIKRARGLRFIFDMRGFWPDERVDGGLWPADGAVYRVAKWFERRFLRDADEIVTLTIRARGTVERWPGVSSPKVTVIPTCADLSRYRPPAIAPSVDDGPVVVYSGSIGTWYMLDEMFAFVEVARERFPRAAFLLLTRNRTEADAAVDRSSLPRDRVTIAGAAPDQVPGWLLRGHVGLAFYKPGFARQATCPTKIAEYLGTGLPVVVNDAVGDVQEVIAGNRVGIVLSTFSREAYREAVDRLADLWADPGLAARCREVAETYFSLDLGVTRYWEIYERIA